MDVIGIRFVALEQQYVKIPADSELFDWILTYSLLVSTPFVGVGLCATIKHVLESICASVLVMNFHL